MDMASFHRLRLAVQDSARPAAEADATAVQEALSQGLAACGLFDQVELGLTDNPDQLVIGVCRCAASVLPWESGYGVERLWKRLAAAYPWEAHHVGATDAFMELEGALTLDGGHYVTVHLVAEAAQVAVADEVDGRARSHGATSSPV